MTKKEKNRLMCERIRNICEGRFCHQDLTNRIVNLANRFSSIRDVVKMVQLAWCCEEPHRALEHLVDLFEKGKIHTFGTFLSYGIFKIVGKTDRLVSFSVFEENIGLGLVPENTGPRKTKRITE